MKLPDVSALKEKALRNYQWLVENPYPGRGIVVGVDTTATSLIQIYWIMGRSENSRNRVFKADDNTGRLYTVAADASRVKDPSLIIYNAMRESGAHFIVSNGNQTDTFVEELHHYGRWSLEAALRGRIYEPDAPNFTQRITAVSWVSGGKCRNEMSILRKSAFGDECDRLTYKLNPGPGFGYCITTYAGNGNPLPPFCGDPLLMPLQGSPQDIAEAYWQALNEDNRISLAVKWIDLARSGSQIHIINKY